MVVTDLVICVREVLSFFWSTGHITPVPERICSDVSLSQTDVKAVSSALMDAY